MTGIRITFVLPNNATDESDASQLMIQAYDSCKQLVNNISWIKEADLPTVKFTKLDYVVFEDFESRDFSKLIESKCAVVGPLAVSVCLMEGKPIPNFQWPISNVAMYGCEVTCSQLSKSEKESIRNKVQLMGGFYTGNLTDSITHLVCDGTKSEKYMLAAEKGVKLMLPGWINHIFKISQSSNINANDPAIIEKFKCPPLHNLTICSTGITSSKERAKLSEIISANGGTMVMKLALSKTDILICHGPNGTNSDKYKAARNTPHISCVTLDWIFDSIEKGYALPHEKYRVKKLTSTPIKEGENVDPNFSTLSAIGGSTTLRKTHINDTLDVFENGTDNCRSSNTKKVSNKRKAEDDLVENIDIKKVKNAGHFLDGCSVFVAGFSPTYRDKLNKIINISGATRYDEFSERVSHIIVGDPSCPEMTAIRAMSLQCCLVSVQWLLDSIEHQRPADENKYVVNGDFCDNSDLTNIGSPLSKKAISFLRTDKTVISEENTISKPADVTVENDDDPLTQKYLKTTDINEEDDTLAKLLGNQYDPVSTKASNSEEFSLRTRHLTKKNNVQDGNQTLDFKPHETSTQVSQLTTDLSESDGDVLPIFSSRKFILDGFDEETTDLYKSNIVACGGTVMDKRFKGVCDFAVFPIINGSVNLPPVQEIVNELWLIQCIENKYLYTDIEYYHRPIELPSTYPLQGCVITISGYAGEEREFLKSIIIGLGGIFQELFSRKTSEARNVLASTHLVSPEASGKKYEAALRWNLPVTSKEWLLECAKIGKKVAVSNFLIGESKSADNSDSSAETSYLNIKEKDQSCKDSSTECKNNPNFDGNCGDLSKINHESVNTSTPKCTKQLDNTGTKTPVNQIYTINQKNTPDACSQVTPINKILQDAINNKVLPTPPSPKTYYPWDPKTPDTPIGAFIRPNPSPKLRKEMQKYVNSFPEFIPPKRRLSTPLSELKRRLIDRVLGKGEFSQDAQSGEASNLESVDGLESEKDSHLNVSLGVHEPRKNNEDEQINIGNDAVHQKLQELKQRVMASGSSSAARRSSRAFEASTNLPGIEKTNVEVQSQVCTVGWDYGEEKTQNPQQKVFMLSGVEASQREQLANSLKGLGALVSESSNYDASSTHLICPKPGRSEKTLACLAAGKWILHVSYVEKSVSAGKFLDEEEFEFGNPKARGNIFYEEKDNSVYFWRKEINKRGYGAFNDMRAIIIAEKKEPIAKVIEAGGGIIINVEPPFVDAVHATHCLLEIKMVKDFSKYVVLAQQGIKCVNTIYVNDFLWRIKKDDLDYIIPYFSKYYK